MVAQIDKLYRALGFKKLWQRLLAYIFFEGRPATTRGRSWNVVVLTWLKVLANNPIPFKPASPVLIVGTGRSGTTLLGILLSSHPELAFLNEPKAAWYVANKRDDIIGTYSSSTGTYLLQTSDATTKIAARIQRIHSAYRNIAGAGQVVDKYPELVFRSGYVHSIYPKSKWIFIARNGYDTALSVKAWCNKMAVNRGGVVEDWWGVDHNKWNAFVAQVVKLDPQWGLRADEILRITSNRLRAIIEWIFSMEYGLALQDCDYINVSIVRYEDLCSNPTEELGALFDFIGVSKDEKALTFASRCVSDAKQYTEFELPTWVATRFKACMNRLGYRN